MMRSSSGGELFYGVRGSSPIAHERPRTFEKQVELLFFSGFRRSPTGHGKDPSPDLVPRPPSPLGEGCGPLGAPPHISIIALSLGERGDRKAVGEGSFPNAQHPWRSPVPELLNF